LINLFNKEIDGKNIYKIDLENKESYFLTLFNYIKNIKLDGEETTIITDAESDEVPDKKEFVLIGRGKDCDIITDPEYKDISRKHIKIYYVDNVFFLEDLGGQNGTFVNYQLIKRNSKIKLEEGDIIELGKSKLDIDLNHIEIRNLTRIVR